MASACEEDVLQELAAREPIFHRVEFGTTRAEFEAMMAPEFWEVGALRRSEFRCQRLAQDLYLPTYTLCKGDDRWTRRAAVWERTADGWRIAFHHGTVVEDKS